MPESNASREVVNVDRKYVYKKFNQDFGPLNLGMMTDYIKYINSLLDKFSATRGTTSVFKQLVHHTHSGAMYAANSAVLMGAFMIMELDCTAEQAWVKFKAVASKFLPFNDAGKVPTNFELRAESCLKAIERAKLKGWYNHRTFDSENYHKLNSLDEGDINWIIPGKLLAMSSPSINRTEGLSSHFFCPVFKRIGVKSLIRLNERLYDDLEMTNHGIRVYPMEIRDGGNPTELQVV